LPKQQVFKGEQVLEMEEAQIWAMGKLPVLVRADPIDWIAKAENC